MVERLNVGDLCDVVYAIWVDRVTDLDALDTWLASVPVHQDPAELELYAALGLRGKGG